jgi:gamma-glutamyltranspeptidase/glutathione hydrolase
MRFAPRTCRVVWLCLWLLLPPGAGADAPGHHAVASAHPAATAAGRSVLDAGGNAFDAAVAVAAALAVVEPYSSGMGGGGFFLVHRASDGHEIMIDARETAPAAATADMYLDEHGEFVPTRSLDGALAAGIPGLAAGLVHLSEHYGRLALADVLAPAIALARDGFAVGERYSMMAGFRTAALKADATAASIFLVDGEAPPVGAVIRQPDLARTLEALATGGAAGFYAGDIAARLVAGANAAGGIWTLADLAAYEIKERAPIEASYRGIRVVSAPPPSSGGIVLIEALNILAHFDLDALDPIDRMHVIIEAMRRAYRDRADYLGDPDFVTMPIAELLDGKYAAGLAAGIDVARATPSSALPGIGLDQRGRDTTHFSVIDAAGNRVAATLSINYPFGAASVPPGTGVLLNNEMDDFSPRPLTPNAYGLVGAGANAIAPGKRPLSSMTPTFLEGPQGVAILGTPGGSRIISMVLIGALEYARGAPPETWVGVPRYHHQYLPDEVQFEEGGLDPKQQAALRAKGHVLSEIKRNYGNMQAVLWDRRNGRVAAASDPRGEGQAQVWACPAAAMAAPATPAKPALPAPCLSADSARRKSSNAVLSPAP